ncbi:LPXTG cell wall anchor domain-containing protein [Nocardioides sp.]|uniref:LPXTG cell wall anchor domain-containing protein n=1 Tax=Nocardioides sp. TaxID=35761 RepID=UPI00271F2BC8|nr:LPXTG cell wall anchor domain-containing protein [Nocardioides sp.]MDO9457446.1 LPXTG cell wall anchor domain-containing protein [Nocardioides sp.]
MTTLLLLVGLVLLSVGATVTAASADDDTLQVSADGVTWSQNLKAPLFEPRIRWVPGDVRERTFYVRNNRPDAGDLQLVVERAKQDALLETGTLTLAARAGNGPWTEIESGGRHALIDDDAIGGRDEVKVQVRATMDYDAPNGTMVLDSDLAFDLRLTDSDAGTNTGTNTGGGSGGGTSDGDGNAGASGNLPDTGAQLRPWLLPFALLLLGFGALLVTRRTTDDEEQHP